MDSKKTSEIRCVQPFAQSALATVPGWTRAPAAEEAQAGGRGVEGAEGRQNHGGHRLHLRGLLAALLHYVGFIHSFETKFNFHIVLCTSIRKNEVLIYLDNIFIYIHIVLLSLG